MYLALAEDAFIILPSCLLTAPIIGYLAVVLKFPQYHNKNSDILSQDYDWGGKKDEGSFFARHLKKKKKKD